MKDILKSFVRGFVCGYAGSIIMKQSKWAIVLTRQVPAVFIFTLIGMLLVTIRRSRKRSLARYFS